MRIKLVLSVVFILLFQRIVSQDTISVNTAGSLSHNTAIGGFIRGGFYTWTSKSDKKLYVPDAFSDLGIKIETGNGKIFKALADLRYRYGAQFSEPVSKFDLRELYIRLNGHNWDLTAGQKIIKWGRADFTNPTSKLSPQDLLFRSPDRDDMNLGNLLAESHWYPSQRIGIEAVLIPFCRPSTLIIDPVPLPPNVTINRINGILTNSKYAGYGIKADFHVKGLDWSFSWFDGFDPMPGIALTTFALDLSQPIPVPDISLSEEPYRIRMAGTDFETSVFNVGIRGEAAWSTPQSSGKSNEYIPLPEIKWVTGFDWFSGNWHFIGEYSGKYITNYTISAVQPIVGTAIDYSQLAILLSDPGFNLKEYIRQGVASFNRLYNYQLYKFYHTIGFRVEADLDYGRLAPSVFASFNITSRDLLLIPEIKFKPADGLTLTAGAEIYSGRKGSLFDIVNDFMDGVYISLRADF